MEIAALMKRRKLGRKIEGIAAVLLPFEQDGRIAVDAFQKNVAATHRAGLKNAVNMDTGYINYLTEEEKLNVLQWTRAALGEGVPFVAGAFIEGEILRYHRMRMISAAVNKRPGPDASLRKALADPHGKKVFTLGRDLMGAEGMLAGTDVTDAWQPWMRGFLFSPALTVGGGTSEVLRNIIAERLLGLPHDHDVEQGLTWQQSRHLAATR